MSKRLIKSALVELLLEDSLQHINVTRICKEADINRSTFYAHYEDIFDVMEDIEEDFVQKISFARSGQSTKITLSQVRNIVSYIDKHKDTFLVLLENGYLCEKYKAEWMLRFEEKGISREERNLTMAIVSYSVEGSFHILKKWATHELEIPYQELILVIYQLIEGSKRAKKEVGK